MYLLIAQSCSNCNSSAVILLQDKPDEEKKRALKDEIGGMYCIHTTEVEIKNFDEIVVVKE